MAGLLYMVVNTETMQVLQLGGLELICAKQFLENPEAKIDTSPVGFGGSYSCYSKEQLKMMATHLMLNPELPYGELISAIKAKLVANYALIKPTLQTIEYYEQEIKKRMKKEPELYDQFTPEAPEPVVTKRFSASSSNESNKPKTAAATRPSGGKTKLVWDISDELKAKNPSLSPKELRPKIIEACEAQDINASTAGTQYSKWKNSVEWNQE